MLAALRMQRIVRAVLGAASGFLIAMALVVAGMPLIPGTHVEVACFVAAALGALIAAVLPVQWIAALAVAVAVAVFLVTFTPVAEGGVYAWIRRDAPPTRAPDAVVVLATTITADGFLDATG